jgi:hypothetical protein
MGLKRDVNWACAEEKMPTHMHRAVIRLYTRKNLKTAEKCFKKFNNGKFDDNLYSNLNFG